MTGHGQTLPAAECTKGHQDLPRPRRPIAGTSILPGLGRDGAVTHASHAASFTPVVVSALGVVERSNSIRQSLNQAVDERENEVLHLDLLALDQKQVAPFADGICLDARPTRRPVVVPNGAPERPVRLNR